MLRVLHNIGIQYLVETLFFGTSCIATRRSAHNSSPGGQSWGLGGRGGSNYYKSCHCCSLSPPPHTPRQPGVQLTHFTQLCPSGSVIFLFRTMNSGILWVMRYLLATDKTVSFNLHKLILSRFWFFQGL